MAWRMALSERLELFEKLCKLADPKLVAYTLEETLVSLKREGFKVEELGEEVFVEVFSLLKEGVAKEAIPDLLRLACTGLSVRQAVERLGLKPMGRGELRALVRQVIQEREAFVRERGESALKPLMGVVMEKVRGKIDGKIVFEVLQEELRDFLSR
jgi:glutamyl-tRNA(Gln) amidotransferase subunit E